MSSDSKPENLNAEAVRRLAEESGLARAHALGPDAFKAAIERGARRTQPLAASTTEPAAEFSVTGDGVS